MAQAGRDQNNVPTLLGVSSTDGTTPITVYVNPTTHRVLTDTAGGGSGVTSINADTTAAQLLAVGTTGTDFAIVDNGTGTHTFNLPDASATARGVVTTGAQTIAGAKTFSSTIVGSVNGNAATVTTNANLTGAVTSSGNATSLGSFSSANLATALTDETGSGAAVFAASPTFTGTPTLPTGTIATTQSANNNSTAIATTAYVDAQHIGLAFLMGCATSNPADATSYYFGPPDGAQVNTVENFHNVYIPKAGTIKSVYFYLVVAGTLGTSETSTVAVRLNATTDTTISAAVKADAATQLFSNTALSIAVVAGDFFSIKWTTPTWVTNPTNCRVSVTVYME